MTRTPAWKPSSTRCLNFKSSDNHPAPHPPPARPQWWSGTLVRRADAERDGQGRQVYVLLYDADADAGYPDPTEHRVSFLDDHELFDVGECDLLDWRVEGTQWERPRPDAKMVEEPGVGLVEEVSLADVAERGRRINLAAGRTLRGEMAALVAGLPPEAQHGLAERLEAGIAAFAEGMAAMQAENEGGVIKQQHVEEMLKKLQARLGSGGAPPPGP